MWVSVCVCVCDCEHVMYVSVPVYIYIYICVCVCVWIELKKATATVMMWCVNKNGLWLTSVLSDQRCDKKRLKNLLIFEFLMLIRFFYFFIKIWFRWCFKNLNVTKVGQVIWWLWLRLYIYSSSDFILLLLLPFIFKPF